MTHDTRPATTRRSVIVGLATSTCLAAACYLPPLPEPPPDPPPKYYVVGLDVDEGAVAPRPAQGGEVLDKDASQRLASGATVAFFPPDRCRVNIAGTPDCVALIARLESAAAGTYEVVPWKDLEGSDPLARAAERKVQVVLEIGELSVDDGGGGTAASRDLNFYEQTTADDRTSLVVDRPIAERCNGSVSQAKAAMENQTTWTATIAAKGVDPKSGTPLWSYEGVASDGGGNANQRAPDFFFEAPGTIDYVPPERRKSGLQKGGGGLLIGGAVFGAAGIGARVIGFSNDDSQPISAIGGSLILLGGVSLVAGAVLLALGNSKAKKTVLSGGEISAPRYPAAPEVLCVGAPVTPPWLQADAPAEAQGEAGSSTYEFSGSSTISNPKRERRERLVGAAADDLLRELAQVR